MSPLLKNFLALLAGFIAGSMVNMGLIIAGGSLIPPPPGVDTTDMESMRASMHLLEPRHFLFPFLAHAIGTFAGAFLAALIAASHKLKIALVIGVLSLLGGMAAAMMIPAPDWFVGLDLIVAYIPMAALGGVLARKLATREEPPG